MALLGIVPKQNGGKKGEVILACLGEKNYLQKYAKNGAKMLIRRYFLRMYPGTSRDMDEGDASTVFGDFSVNLK